MFHRAPDASKVALVRLVEILTEDGVRGRLLDCQWTTPHLISMGAVDVSRETYQTPAGRRAARCRRSANLRPCRKGAPLTCSAGGPCDTVRCP